MGNLPKIRYISINKAAEKLGVSTKTLRRWEAAGKLVPVRTKGGHRRYIATDLLALRAKNQVVGKRMYLKKEKAQVLPKENKIVEEKVFYQPTSSLSQPLYQDIVLAPQQIKFLKTSGYFLFSFLILFITLKISNPLSLSYKGLTKNLGYDAKFYATALPMPSAAKMFIAARSEDFPKANTNTASSQAKPAVLAAQNLPSSFNVNIGSAFKEVANFIKGLTALDVATGTLEATGSVQFLSDVAITGDVTSPSTTFNFLPDTVTTLNIGEAATNTSISATTGTTTINNDLVGKGTLAISGKITGSGDLAISGASALSGAVTAGSTLAVSGATTLSSSLAVAGNATFGDITKVNGVTYTFPTAAAAGANYVLSSDTNGTLTWQSLASSGGLTGTGAAGQVTFWDSASTVTGSNSFFWDSTNNRLGIGDTTPLAALTVGSGDLFQVNSSGNIAAIGGAAHSIANSSNTLAISSVGDTTITPGSSSNLFNVLTGNLKVGDGTPTTTLAGEAAYIEGTLETDGHVAFGGSSKINDGSLLSAGTFKNTLALQESYTDLTTSDYVEGITNYVSAGANTAGTQADIYGADNEVSISGAQSMSGNSAYGIYNQVFKNGENTLGFGIGSYNSVSRNAGTLTNGYGSWNDVGNATNGYGVYAVNTFNLSTAGATQYGGSFNLSNTGAATTGTNNNYGLYTNVARTGATGGTINTYGNYINIGSLDDAGAGTHTAYGLYVSNVTGADTNYAAYFAGGNVNIQSLSASSGVYTDSSNNLTSTVPSSGTVGYWSRSGTTLQPSTAGDALTTSGNISTSGSGTITSASDLAVNGNNITTATTTNFADNATTALNIGNGSGSYTAINIGSGSGTHTINIAGTGATSADTINIGTGGTAADTINIGSNASTTALNFTSGTGAQTFTSSNVSGQTTSGSFVFTDNTLTTGDGLYLNSSSLTTGNLFNLSSTSTGLTSGSLMKLDWSPGSSTTATGDLFSLNVGANALVTGNIFNIKNNGSSLFAVNQAQITNALPTQFTAPGDIAAAYDLQFTNSVASYIKSSAPLYMVAGETFNSSNLTLRTYNLGNILLDTGTSSTGTGKVGIGPTVTPTSLFHVSNRNETTTVGQSLALFDQGESQDILTASAAGTTKFTIGSDTTTGDDLAKFISSTITTGNILSATSSAITSGNLLKLGQGGNSTFSGNAILADIGNTGSGGNGFTGKFINLQLAGSSKFTIGSTGLTDASTDGVATKVVAGAITDSSFTGTAVNGLLGIDSSNGRIYFRYGGAWHYAAQTAGFQIPNNETYSYDFGSKSFDTNKPLNDGDFLIPFVDTHMADGAIHGLYTRFSDVKNLLLADQNEKIASLEAQINSLSPDATGSASFDLALFNSIFTATDSGVIANLHEVDTSKLNVLGDATLGDTVINGKLNVGTLTFDNVEQSINAIGTLKIQDLALGNVEFMNGLITFDTNGNAKVKTITADKYKVAGTSAGNSKILANQTSVVINTDQVADGSLIFVTANTKTDKTLSVTQKTSGTSFKVEINSASAQDIAFNWWIVDKE